jgi:hypothetical protein
MHGGPLPEAKPSGIRDSNGLYSEMSAALEWGLAPGEWYSASRAERAMMIATSAAKAQIESAVMNDGNKRK